MIPILLALAAAQAPMPPTVPPIVSPAQSTAQAPAPGPDAEARYRSCTELVRSDPRRAIEVASGWRLEGGGYHARNCLGLAYVALEQWPTAAAVYQQAAEEAARARDPQQADFLVQAGNAWLAGGEPTRAIQAFDAALATANLTNELRGEVHIDRARALVAMNNLAAARENLDRAIQLVPADPFGWYMSAALAQRENNLARARTDIERAMQLAPDNPEIALLGGTLAGLAGNMVEAERLYRRVAEGAPDSEAGRAARASLETLREVEVPAPAATPAPTPPAPAAAAPAPAPQPDQSR